jgi:hypothetical protein
MTATWTDRLLAELSDAPPVDAVSAAERERRIESGPVMAANLVRMLTPIQAEDRR